MKMANWNQFLSSRSNKVKYYYPCPVAVKYWDNNEYATGIAYQEFIIGSENVGNGYVPRVLKIDDIMEAGRARNMSDDDIIVELEWELI